MDPDQTARMHRLVWMHAGRKTHYVDFVMTQLIKIKDIFPCCLWNMLYFLWRMGLLYCVYITYKFIFFSLIYMTSLLNRWKYCLTNELLTLYHHLFFWKAYYASEMATFYFSKTVYFGILLQFSKAYSFNIYKTYLLHL
jgi:hypothetical protein